VIDAIATFGPNNRLVFDLRYPTYLHGNFAFIAASHGVSLEYRTKADGHDTLTILREDISKVAVPSFSSLPDQDRASAAQNIWQELAKCTIDFADGLRLLGAGDDIVNRMLIPFSHIDVRATEGMGWDALLALRDSLNVAGEIRELLRVMFDCRARRMM